MAFDALEAAVSMVEALGPVEAKVRARRKSLADEVGRAGESVALKSGPLAKGRGDWILSGRSPARVA